MQRILVALDGSPGQTEVLAAALTLAQEQTARLILFHSVSLPLPLPVSALAVPPDQVSTIMLESSQKALEELARTAPRGVIERVQVELGVPWRAVCEAARTDGVDLVIIGSHGYGGIDRLLGTTAAKIVDHAPCSVLVVRPKT
jgi:universal stress protein F